MEGQLEIRPAVKGQIVKIPEDLQFELVRQLRELKIWKKILETRIRDLEREIAGMRFEFQKTPAIPYKSKKKLIEEGLYVSQSGKEFFFRVFWKSCMNGIVLVLLLMIVKFLEVCFQIGVLEKMAVFISAHFGLAVGCILAGCVIVSAAEVLHRDRKNTLKIEKMNREITLYNQNAEQQNELIKSKNLRSEEADRKREEEERQIYQKKRREKQKELYDCNGAHRRVLRSIKKILELNMLPEILFKNSEMLERVYYLRQNRITTTLYGTEGELEIARNMIQEEKMMANVQQMINQSSQIIEKLSSLYGSIKEVHTKLDGIDCQLANLSTSQAQINTTLSEVYLSGQDTLMEIKNQNDLWREKNENKSV